MTVLGALVIFTIFSFSLMQFERSEVKIHSIQTFCDFFESMKTMNPHAVRQ